MFYASANQFREFGHAITEQNSRRKGRKRSVERETRRFKAFFGIKAERALVEFKFVKLGRGSGLG